jgi:hypothetical protein
MKLCFLKLACLEATCQVWSLFRLEELRFVCWMCASGCYRWETRQAVSDMWSNGTAPKESLRLYLRNVHMGPPLWSCGQSSWLQIQRSGFDSLRYKIFWELLGLERCPLSLVSTIEELLEIKRSFSGLENLEYGRRNPSLWPRGTIYPQ